MALLNSCEKEDDGLKNKTAIKFEANYQTLKSALLKSANATEVVVESFKINIEEIEIEFDSNDPMFLSDSVATDYEMDGPFEVDLMKDGNALETTVVKNVELPSAAYEEIEFKFRESENPISDMYGKSILIEGTIDGSPFIFWSDEEIEVEIEFEEFVYLDEASRAVLTVSFDLASLFNPALGGIDITSATDGNENGIIEIYPEDPDGNSDLADLVWEKIEDIIEAFEEKYYN
ncbi:DUF4382 domain-containing protein [Marinilabiliaceae bacterium ANBcel2]|nr:DUF4382 domain-containing protein [Marinilabiliaceae bacterium ANBcel2]